mmetsp:Transcript_18108/g.24280  ORF Transcript_18108/g.24280 Transcript_18108/m.24280 type:complete len:88 (-) Transcript_18108:75-338(-)
MRRAYLDEPLLRIFGTPRRAAPFEDHTLFKNGLTGKSTKVATAVVGAASPPPLQEFRARSAHLAQVPLQPSPQLLWVVAALLARSMS